MPTVVRAWQAAAHCESHLWKRTIHGYQLRKEKAHTVGARVAAVRCGPVVGRKQGRERPRLFCPPWPVRLLLGERRSAGIAQPDGSKAGIEPDSDATTQRQAGFEQASPGRHALPAWACLSGPSRLSCAARRPRKFATVPTLPAAGARAWLHPPMQTHP